MNEQIAKIAALLKDLDLAKRVEWIKLGEEHASMHEVVELLILCTSVMPSLIEENEELRTAMLLMLDNVDYGAGNCRINEPIGGVLPVVILVRARKSVGR